MTDPFPRWPPDWLDEHGLAAEEVLAESADLTLASALRADGQTLLSVSWPGGRRYLLVDPIGNHAPQALRIGAPSDDPDVARAVDGLWSRALELAKRLIDGDIDALTVEPPPSRKRRWRRGSG